MICCWKKFTRKKTLRGEKALCNCSSKSFSQALRKCFNEISSGPDLDVAVDWKWCSPLHCREGVAVCLAAPSRPTHINNAGSRLRHPQGLNNTRRSPGAARPCTGRGGEAQRRQHLKELPAGPGYQGNTSHHNPTSWGTFSLPTKSCPWKILPSTTLPCL